jgi:phage gpG-like protein
MRLITDTKQLEETKNTLQDLTSGITLSGSERDIVSKVGKATAGQFASLGSRSGTPWVKSQSGKQTLRDTGALFAAATNPKFSLVNGGKEIEITFTGIHSELIAIHQFGALIRRQTKQGSRTIRIPARLILTLTSQDVDEIAGSAFTKLAESISKKLT